MKNKTVKICLSGKRNTQLKTLQAESDNKAPQNPYDSRTRKVYFYGFKKSYISGSLTVEASLVIPLFLFFVLFLVSIFEIYRVQTLINISVHQSVMELGMYSYESKITAENEMFSAIACQLYTKNQLPEIPDWMEISVFAPLDEENTICIKTKIICKIPLLLLPTLQKTISSNNKVKAWTGRDLLKNSEQIENSNIEMVYVSQYESVYHTSSKCTHLSRNLEWCKKGLISSKRNQNGEKYRSCEKCVDSETIRNNTNVFYTEKGDCYHMSDSCSGIKRTIILIDKREVSSLEMCERCKSREYT